LNSFDEFKGFYNAAIDDARGRKRVPKPSLSRSKTSSGLSDETKNARKKLAEEKARKKAEEAERIRKENAEMKARVMAEKKKDDPPGKMDEEILRKRKEMAEDRKRKKEEEARRLKMENRQMTKKLHNVQAVTDSDITDDAGGAIQAMREQKAIEAAEAKEALEVSLKERQKTMQDMKANATSRTDHDITDDDGGRVQRAREQRAAAAIEKQATHKTMLKDRQKSINNMKANANSKTDHDITDDISADGQSVQAARDAKAAAGYFARQAEDAAQKARAHELRGMS